MRRIWERLLGTESSEPNEADKERAQKPLEIDWDTVKPCPFCGAELDDCMNSQDWQIVCFMCSARGPRFIGDMQEALRRWNQRDD